MKNLIMVLLLIVATFIGCTMINSDVPDAEFPIIDNSHVEVRSNFFMDFKFKLYEDSSFYIFSKTGEMVYGKASDISNLPFSDGEVLINKKVSYNHDNGTIRIYNPNGIEAMLGFEDNQVGLEFSGYAWNSSLISSNFDFVPPVIGGWPARPNCRCIKDGIEVDGGCDVGGPLASGCSAGQTKGGGATIMGSGGSGTLGENCGVNCKAGSYACCDYTGG